MLSADDAPDAAVLAQAHCGVTVSTPAPTQAGSPPSPLFTMSAAGAQDQLAVSFAGKDLLVGDAAIQP
jgi:hypothetical protein